MKERNKSKEGKEDKGMGGKQEFNLIGKQTIGRRSDKKKAGVKHRCVNVIFFFLSHHTSAAAAGTEGDFTGSRCADARPLRQ